MARMIGKLKYDGFILESGSMSIHGIKVNLSDEDYKLFLQIKNLVRLLQKDKIQNYKRYLPLGDLLIDRWEKAKDMKWGDGTSIYDSTIVLGNVTVGKNTWIGPNVILDGSGKLNIGNNCSISAGVQLYTHDSVQWAISGGEKSYDYAPTSIGNNCYIAPNTVVSKGVIIGDGCIVGANSYVNKSWPAGSKIAGSPAKQL